MTQRKNPVKAIYEFCLSCCGDSYKATKECSATDCALYAFRLGKNPYRVKRELSDEEKSKRAKILKQAREARHGNNQG